MYYTTIFRDVNTVFIVQRFHFELELLRIHKEIKAKAMIQLLPVTILSDFKVNSDYAIIGLENTVNSEEDIT
ncbi:hypothetical protein BAVI_09311 [Neobacillus vireti LMG 21834]|uniref:Uncharacterized protein n=1 Tax=Neobacillus vireti LMG 21834 TaxID=1131730 RepID=A0AB94IPT4_9BACI|nr:hypothetical protein BAVI_09311 [Neobacillus vireti LMG 21834]KLT15750.1 hypothetical protein AA980_21235 [Neobacillus vireti]